MRTLNTCVQSVQKKHDFYTIAKNAVHTKVGMVSHASTSFRIRMFFSIYAFALMNVLNTEAPGKPQMKQSRGTIEAKRRGTLRVLRSRIRGAKLLRDILYLAALYHPSGIAR